MSYLVRVHGHNLANQEGAIAIVGGRSERLARLEFEANTDNFWDTAIYSNQFLEFVPLSKAKLTEVRAVEEQVALAETHRQFCEHLFTGLQGKTGFCVYCGKPSTEPLLADYL